MIIYGALFIPVLSAFILYRYFNRYITWWEFFLPLATSLLFTFLMKIIIEKVQVSSKEYWGSLVERVEYYEDWNEYIHRTCTTTCCCDSKGQNCQTQTYDCSYVLYHPPSWRIVTTNKETVSISESEYQRLKQKFNNEQFTELNNNYYTDDGDMYSSSWPHDSTTAVPVTTVHYYDNRVKAADQSVFHFRPVDKADIARYTLKKYPTITGYYNMQAVIGDSSEDALIADKKLQYINGLLGAKKEIRIFVLVFKNQPVLAGFYQEWYWSGANMNEFVICIGVDKERNVQWCKPISWTRSEILKSRIKSYVEGQKNLNLQAVVDYTRQQAEKDFVRRDFKEFNYLTVEPPTWAVVLTYILTVLVNIGVCWWAIRNEFTDENYESDLY